MNNSFNNYNYNYYYNNNYNYYYYILYLVLDLTSLEGCEAELTLVVVISRDSSPAKDSHPSQK